MKTPTISGLTPYLMPLAAAILFLSGCAGSNKPPTVVTATPAVVAAAPAATPSSPPPKRAESMPPGRTHGMPSTSLVPDPEWYAERFNRARGVGEALRRDHVALWDKEAMAYTYFVGGVFYASYQPYQHVLRIRTDNRTDTETECEWDAEGTLTSTPAGDADTCRGLLDELDRHIAHTGHYPPIGAAATDR